MAAMPRQSNITLAIPNDDCDQTPTPVPRTTTKRRRNLIAASRQGVRLPGDVGSASPENGRGFAGRYGPVIAAANFNVWPHALLLDADDGVPHWRRIGLDRSEVFFLMVVLSHYFARGNWPAVSIERFAGWLDLSERRVQQLKNALIDDGYVIRITRHDRDGNRRPDALDCSPLFALLEACLLRYHPNLITRDAAPVWIAPGPTLEPLDPDEFGNRRRSRRRRGSIGEATNHLTPDQRSVSVKIPTLRPVQPTSSVGETRLHHAEEADCTRSDSGSDPTQRGGRAFRSPKPAVQSEDEPNRALAAPGGPPPDLENVGRGMARPLPFNDRLSAVVAQHARRFRDDDPEQSIATAHHLWWNAHLPLSTFVALLDRAAVITSQTISRGQIHHGTPGARQAMPYYFRVVGTLCREATRTEG